MFGQFERASNLNLVFSSSTCQLKAGDTKDEPCPQLFEEEAVACKCMTCTRGKERMKRTVKSIRRNSAAGREALVLIRFFGCFLIAFFCFINCRQLASGDLQQLPAS